MTYRTRTYYTDSQKALMWERWKAGWTLHEIGHLFDRRHTSIQGILSRTAFDRQTDAVPWRRCRWTREKKSRARWGQANLSAQWLQGLIERHRQSVVN